MAGKEEACVTLGGHRIDILWDPSGSAFCFEISYAWGGSEILRSSSQSTLMQTIQQTQQKEKEEEEEDKEQKRLKEEEVKKKAEEDEEVKKKDKEGKKKEKTTRSNPERTGEINQVLPPEIISIILEDTYREAPAVTVVLKFVCRFWRDLIGSSMMQHLTPRKKSEYGMVGVLSARRGWVSLLQWAREKGCYVPRGEIWVEGAREGHMEVLEWAVQHRLQRDSRACAAAARQGRLDLLRWLREKDCPWDGTTCAEAARGGHLDVLRWVKEEGECKWDEHTTYAAAEGGHLDVLTWVVEHDDCEGTWVGLLWAAARGGSVDVVQWVLDRMPSGEYPQSGIMAAAAENGHLQLLKHLREKGWNWGASACRAAAQHRHFEVLRWLRENGCPWKASTFHHAARSGKIEVLTWLREQGCPAKASVCEAAAMSDNLHALQWLRSQGYPWDERVVLKAAKRRNLQMLRWAGENGCPWTSRVCKPLTKDGRLDLLQWVFDLGCPLNDRMCSIAARVRNFRIIKWARRHKPSLYAEREVLEYGLRHRDFKVLRYALKVCNEETWNQNFVGHSLNEEVSKDLLEWMMREKKEVVHKWGPELCRQAAMKGNLELLKYFRQEGLPWDSKVTEFAKTKEILCWALQQGATWHREERGY